MPARTTLVVVSIYFHASVPLPAMPTGLASESGGLHTPPMYDNEKYNKDLQVDLLVL